MPPRFRAPVVRTVRTPEAIDALRARLDLFDPSARQSGRDYFQGGAVLRVWSEADHHVKAEVEGGARYGLTLFYTRGDWTARCSCAVGVGCKHAYAASLAWIASSEAGARDGRDPASLVAAVAPSPLLSQRIRRRSGTWRWRMNSRAGSEPCRLPMKRRSSPTRPCWLAARVCGCVSMKRVAGWWRCVRSRANLGVRRRSAG